MIVLLYFTFYYFISKSQTNSEDDKFSQSNFIHVNQEHLHDVIKHLKRTKNMERQNLIVPTTAADVKNLSVYSVKGLKLSIKESCRPPAVFQAGQWNTRCEYCWWIFHMQLSL